MKALVAGICCLFAVPFFALAQESATTTAASVDIVIEADTVVPAFYEGRQEPSVGSPMRAIAIVNDAGLDSYTFRWELEGRVETGDDTLVFTAPLGSPFRIRVDVFGPTGAAVASNERYISLSEPEVVFYPNNLLRGLSATAIGEELILTGDEIEVRAEPYFVNRNLFRGPYELIWRAGGARVEGSANDPQTIVLRRQEGAGATRIEFALQNLQTFSQRIAGAFLVKF